MHDFALAHLTDAALLRDLAALVVQDRTTTASLLAHIAEVDARKLYVPAGYPSMFEYAIEELKLSEDAAYRRIRAARAGRQFPVLLAELAEGRLHLAAICLLAPHLTLENADDLIAAARNRKKSEIEWWLAGRFPGSEPRTVIRPLAAVPSVPMLPVRVNDAELVPGRVGIEDSREMELVPGRVESKPESGEERLVPGRVEAPPQPERFLVQVTISRSTHDKLRYAQDLLSHAVPHGEVAQVLDRALDALIAQLERRKFGAARCRPEASSDTTGKSTAKSRHIPAAVRRAVWKRDEGQCTFVGSDGRRCGTRGRLEFDHVEPVARGGKTSVDGIRLRCRAHNQYEAERAFGSGFMRRKRVEAEKARKVRLNAAVVRAQVAQARAHATQARAHAAQAQGRTEARDQVQDVIAGLRGLGCRADEARRAAELSAATPAASLEERMKAALKSLRCPSRRGLPGSGTLSGWESSIGSGKG